MHDDEAIFLFTFLMLHIYTEGSVVTMMSTLFRRRPVGHEATVLCSLLPRADGKGAICVDVTLSSDKKLCESRSICNQI